MELLLRLSPLLLQALVTTTPAQSIATPALVTVAQVHATQDQVPGSPIFEELLSDPVLANGIVDVETDSSDDRMEEEAES